MVDFLSLGYFGGENWSKQFDPQIHLTANNQKPNRLLKNKNSDMVIRKECISK
jgi:hypothetical protein